MKTGQVIATGPPEQVLTQQLLREVFGLDARVVADPESGGPMVVPRWHHDLRRPQA